MRNACNDITEATKDGFLESQIERDYVDPNLDSIRKDPRSKRFVDRLDKASEKITNEYMEKIRKKLYGTNNEQGLKEALIIKISSALSKRQDVSEIFYSIAYDYTMENMANIDKPIERMFLPMNSDGVQRINLMELPYNMVLVLGVILDQDLLSMNPDSDLNIHNGWFGNLELEWLTERKKSLRTTSPAYTRFFNTIKMMNQNKEMTEKRFMSRSPDIILEKYDYEEKRNKDGYVVVDDKGKDVFTNQPLLYNRRMFGISDMYKTILPELHGKIGREYFETEEQFMMFMHQVMLEQVDIDNDGNVWVMRDRGKRMKGEKVVRHEDSGKPQYKWYGKEPLVIQNKKIMNYDPKLREQALEKEKDKEAKDREFNYWYPKKGFKQLNVGKFDKTFGKSHHEIMMDWIKGIQAQLWAFGTYAKAQADDTTEENQQILIETMNLFRDGKITKEDRDLILDLNNKLMDGTDEKAMAGMHGLDTFELKSKASFFFPKKYTPANWIEGLGDGIRQLQEKILNKRTRMEGMTSKQREYALENVLEMDQSIAFMEQKLGMFEDPEETRDGSKSQSPAYNMNYVKHFKTATESVDSRYTRLDENVARDYIGETVSQIERRKIINQLLRSILETPNKPKTRQAILNLFHKAYNDPTSKGSIFGIRFDNEQFNDIMNKISLKGWGKGTRDDGRFLKSMANVSQFSLLSGPVDGFVNLFSLIQDGFNSGFNNVWDATNEFMNNRQAWEDKAESAGVVTFSKFLEGYVDTMMRSDDTKDLIRFKKELKQTIKDLDKEDITKQNKEKLIQQYQNQLKAVEANIPSLFRRTTNKLVHYAINHKFTMTTYEKGFKASVKKALGLYRVLPSIADTEKMLRTISFIIGYKNAKRLTANDPKIPEKQVVEFARQYVYLTQFGLEPHLVGDALGTDASKWFNAITTWRKNKTSYDFRKMQEWSRARWNPDKILNLDTSNITSKKQLYSSIKYGESVARLLLSFFTTSPFKKAKALRKLAPSIGAGNSLFLIHGIGSAFSYFIAFAHPSSIFYASVMRKFMFKTGGSKLVPGFSSPAITGLFAVGGFAANMFKLYKEDDEDGEIDFWEWHRMLRSFFGVGAMNTFSLIYKTGLDLMENLTDERAYKPGDYHEDPMRHHSFRYGVTGTIEDYIAKPVIEKGKEAKIKWYDNKRFDSGPYGY
tara:strand:- start:2755 stop:6285 length:3531 start_codon:yes stop_codon:yes gene_type:complete